MYFMLLLRLGWIVLGCHLNIHMIVAQLKLAKTGQAFFDTVVLNCAIIPVECSICIISFAMESTARAKT